MIYYLVAPVLGWSPCPFCMCIGIGIRVYVYNYIGMCMCICTCVYIYIYIYTHTHIHTPIHRPVSVSRFAVAPLYRFGIALVLFFPKSISCFPFSCLIQSAV